MITFSFDPRVAVVVLALLVVLLAAFVLVRLARSIRGSSERAESTLRSRLEELEERVRNRIAHLSDKLGRPTGDPLSRLLVTDIKVGKNSQLAAADPLPATIFAVDADPMRQLRMTFDTADISQQMRVDVTNVSDRDELILNGAFIGVAVEDFVSGGEKENAREYAIGLPTTRLPPHCSTPLVARPQIPFRGKRLFLSASFAEGPAPREVDEAAPFYREPRPSAQKPRPWWRNLLPFHRDAAS